jgi:hypothetical protein
MFKIMSGNSFVGMLIYVVKISNDATFKTSSKKN